jgi:hypothetical protein
VFGTVSIRVVWAGFWQLLLVADFVHQGPLLDELMLDFLCVLEVLHFIRLHEKLVKGFGRLGIDILDDWQISFKASVLIAYLLVDRLKLNKLVIKLINFGFEFFLRMGCAIFEGIGRVSKLLMAGLVLLVGYVMHFAGDTVHEVGIVFIKVWVRVNVLIGVFITGDLFEVVNIQLTNEGREIGMLEVFGKNFLRKSRRIPYLKRVLLTPPTDVLRGLILHLNQDLHLAYP